MVTQRGLPHSHIELAALMDSPIEQTCDYRQAHRAAQSVHDLMEFDLRQRWVMYGSHVPILALSMIDDHR